MNSGKLYRSWIRVGSLILFLTLASGFAFGNSLTMLLTSAGGGMFKYTIPDPNVATFSATTLSLTGLALPAALCIA
jgi:hypothetical protein